MGLVHCSSAERAGCCCGQIDQQEEFRGLTTDGSVPLMELKISYYLSDARREGHACTVGPKPDPKL